MQRRPLDPIVNNSSNLISVVTDFLSISGGRKTCICSTPLIKKSNFNDLLKLIGFIEEIPVHPKARKRLFYPEVAPKDQHPTAFLQFGVEMNDRTHVVFEMGDHSRLIRFDFRENWTEGYSSTMPFYQLDELQIWDGAECYSIDCEDEIYKPHILGCIAAVKLTIRAMWEQKNWDEVKECFEKLTFVIDGLDDLNAQLEQDHATEQFEQEKQWQAVLEVEQAEANKPRGQNTNTP